MQSREGVLFYGGDLVLVEGKNLEGVQPVESIFVNGLDLVAVQIQDKQMVKLLQRARRDRGQSVLREVQLRQPTSYRINRANKLKKFILKPILYSSSLFSYHDQTRSSIILFLTIFLIIFDYFP